MTCAANCDWCGEQINGGPTRHAICKIAAAHQQDTPIFLLDALEIEILNMAIRWYKSTMRYAGRPSAGPSARSGS